MLSQDIIKAARTVAADAGIDEAGFLAVVEIESGGKPLEDDGRTPRLLFERHVFFRELKARTPGKLAAAIAAGLAIPKWSRSTQYKDQGTSTGRLALLGQARAIDTECANRACSWGLGQTMGFLAEELGYPSATAMVEQMTAGGVGAQLHMMAQEITRKRLAPRLAAGDWAGFAAAYNGPGYKANAYDTRLASACRRWQRTLATPPSAPKRWTSLADYEVRAVQQRLADLGYPEVGNVDGIWGSRTIGAVSAFQAHEGLPVSGDYDDATRAALTIATPRAPSDARAQTSPADLRAAGSQTIAAADRGRSIGVVIGALGAGGGAQKLGVFDDVQSALDSLNALRPVVDAVRDLAGWLSSSWWVAAVVGGVLVWRQFGSVIRRRVEQQISGEHA